MFAVKAEIAYDSETWKKNLWKINLESDSRHLNHLNDGRLLQLVLSNYLSNDAHSLLNKFGIQLVVVAYCSSHAL